MPLAPARYVRTSVFEAVTGYSVKALEEKIRTGVWIEGHEYRRAPDGHILIDLEGYAKWVEGQRRAV
ncbi:MAG: excisionase [Betaproteobacteria bacterium]|nr:MAG: excisionase [Betaproteobacteria bacterium]